MHRVMEKANEQITLMASQYLNQNLQPLDNSKVRKPSIRVPADTVLLAPKEVFASNHSTSADIGGPAQGKGDAAQAEADTEAARNDLAETTAALPVQDTATTVVEPHEMDGPLDDDGLPAIEDASTQAVNMLPPFDPSAGTFEAALYKLPTDASWGLQFFFLPDETAAVAGMTPDSPASRSVQLKRGMKVLGINGMPTDKCGAAGLGKIMKKAGLTAKSKMNLTMTLELSVSLVPEVVAAPPDEGKDQGAKASWWGRKQSVKTNSRVAPPAPTAKRSDDEEDEDEFDEDDSNRRMSSQFALKSKLRALSVRTKSPQEKANIPVLNPDEPEAEDANTADGRRRRHQVSLAFSSGGKSAFLASSSSKKKTKKQKKEDKKKSHTHPEVNASDDETVGASNDDDVTPAPPAASSSNQPPPTSGDGGKAAFLARTKSAFLASSTTTRNPLYNADNDGSGSDGNEDVDAVLRNGSSADTSSGRVALDNSDYFLSMINNGVEEGDELVDDSGCRFHLADGAKVFREEDVSKLDTAAPAPRTPTGVRKFLGGNSSTLERVGNRHMSLKRQDVEKMEEDEDTKFGFDDGDDNFSTGDEGEEAGPDD
jgi:hypothetical protein